VATFAVTAEQLSILPHSNADALELAVVGGYHAVVLKGQFRSGEYAIYIPEAALLPPELIEELGLVGRLAGSAANRVKAIRLRGELSQGIVCRPSALASIDLAAASLDRTDFAPALGIVKWVPEIPANMSGRVEATPELLTWIEIENIKRFPDLFTPGEAVTGTEKAHGSATLISFSAQSDRLVVSSKGFGSRGLGLIEDEGNLYWRAVRVHDLEPKIRAMAAHLGVERLGVFGEVYGAGVQDLTYGLTSRNVPGFALFDACYLDSTGKRRWIGQAELRALADEVGIPMVPEIYAGLYDYEAIAAAAEGPTVIGAGVHVREGLVLRPRVERFDPASGDRVIAKFINPAYLLRKGGTEFD